MKKLSYLLTILSMTFLFSACDSSESTSVQRKDILDAVFASGHIITDDEYLITAKGEGYLSKSLVAEGDKVSEGVPLFYLSNDVPATELNNAQINYLDAQQRYSNASPQIQELQLQINQAKSQVKNDERNFQRYAKLVKTQAVSESEYEKVKLQYENAQNQVNILEKNLADLRENLKLKVKTQANTLKIQSQNNQDYVLSSRIEGQVLEVFKKPGELVRRGEHIAKIGGGAILIKLFIAEEDIQKIKVGQQATVSLNTNPNELFSARILKVYPAFDTQEQSFVVEAKFDALPDNLYSNTQLQANIVINEIEKALVIPSHYLLEGDQVLIDSDKKKKIEVGIRNLDFVQVLSGLEENQTIYEPIKE